LPRLGTAAVHIGGLDRFLVTTYVDSDTNPGSKALASTEPSPRWPPRSESRAPAVLGTAIWSRLRRSPAANLPAPSRRNRVVSSRIRSLAAEGPSERSLFRFLRKLVSGV